MKVWSWIWGENAQKEGTSPLFPDPSICDREDMQQFQTITMVERSEVMRGSMMRDKTATKRSCCWGARHRDESWKRWTRPQRRFDDHGNGEAEQDDQKLHFSVKTGVELDSTREKKESELQFEDIPS